MQRRGAKNHRDVSRGEEEVKDRQFCLHLVRALSRWYRASSDKRVWPIQSLLRSWSTVYTCVQSSYSSFLYCFLVYSCLTAFPPLTGVHLSEECLWTLVPGSLKCDVETATESSDSDRSVLFVDRSVQERPGFCLLLLTWSSHRTAGIFAITSKRVTRHGVLAPGKFRGKFDFDSGRW